MTNVNEENYSDRCFVYVFDFDDTLIFSNFKIKIFTDSTKKELKFSLTPEQYMHYELESGEFLDFSDFDNDDYSEEYVKTNIRLNPYVFRIMKDAIEQYGNDNVSICSARIKDKPIRTIIETLSELRGVRVAAIGSHDVKTNTTVINAHKKKDYVESILMNAKKHTTLYFYDDSDLNLDAVSTLIQKQQAAGNNIVCMKTLKDGFLESYKPVTSSC